MEPDPDIRALCAVLESENIPHPVIQGVVSLGQ
jgi:hypothetical protein